MGDDARIPSRTSRIAAAAIIGLMALTLVQPYLARLFSETPQVVLTPRGTLSEAERTSIDLFERVSPSVVQVVIRQQDGSNILEEDNGGGGGGDKSGSGFIWDTAGNVVTNNHVIGGASDILVRFAAGGTLGAEIVGTAANYDLAVIRLRNPRTPLRPVAIGSSSDLKIGQFAYAIGNPFGLDQSLSFGVISALHRRLPTNSLHQVANVIQTDAAVNPGNSGGPLLDSSGRVIGVNTAIISPSGSNAGIGFAIPMDVVNRVVPLLIRDGRVAAPGIGIVPVSEEGITRLGVEGIPIMRTMPGYPAARAGLRGVDTRTGVLGDVIVSVNDKPVQRVSDLAVEIDQAGVGSDVRLGIVRNNRTDSVTVTVTDVGQSRLGL